ncbi:aminoacyl-tRNA hydrolase [Gordonia phosphorivorans]|uniref:peptidyl-tRNA hydrolase n=1 Tax=Gordonia phosphorivorans TaxID=1056982 RepID=A0ABV6H5R1_9ACTN
MALSQNFARLAHYSPRGVDPDDPGQVLAMPLVLRIEKSTPPDRAALLEAAAQASIAACLDPRAEPGGEWAEAFDAWCAGRIRKIARRARGASWAAVQELPGVTAQVGAAQARALVPGPVGRADRRVTKLQIEGTDIAGELPSAPRADGRGARLRLWTAPDLAMTVGKLAAQVGHAAMLGAELVPPDAAPRWAEDGCPVQVCQADRRRWAQLLAAAEHGRAAVVRDAGYTEIAPGSVTVIAEALPAE